jgi:glycosyltransferase involved in cell wall biosynthesis
LISIIIPLYNKQDFIAEALQSVLQQTFIGFEVLVVNDGSTDNSEAVVSEIKDDRIKLINIKNRGVSVARNTGIKKAKYPWVAFLDADDWWAPTFLTSIVEAIKQFPEEKVFGTGRSRVFKEVVEQYQNPLLPKKGETDLVNYFKVISQYLPPINSSNVVISKNLLKEKELFIEGMKQHEDHDLWIRLCKNHKVVFINKELSFYRKNVENTASKEYFSAKDFIQYVNTISRVNQKLSEEDRPFFQQYFQKFITIRYFQNCSFYDSSEKEALYDFFRKLIKSRRYNRLLWLIHNTSYFNFYAILKRLKG